MSEVPTSIRIEKPGKSKFAPVLDNKRKANASSIASIDSTTLSATPSSHSATLRPSDVAIQLARESFDLSPTKLPRIQPEEAIQSSGNNNNSASIGSGGGVFPSSSTRIEAVQRRRERQKSISIMPEQTELPNLWPLSARSATAVGFSDVTSTKPRISMAHFLKDSGTGTPMRNSCSSGSNSPISSRSITPPVEKLPSGSNLSTNLQLNRSATSIIAPQVRIVNGEIVVDEDALLTTSSLSKTGNEELTIPMDIVNEGTGRHLTSHAFVKTAGNNRWKAEETEQFYRALSMCGTDFSLIAQFFPRRTREQVKGKYKIEERSNPTKVALFLKNRKPFDIEWLNNAQKQTTSTADLAYPQTRGRPKQSVHTLHTSFLEAQ